MIRPTTLEIVDSLRRLLSSPTREQLIDLCVASVVAPRLEHGVGIDHLFTCSHCSCKLEYYVHELWPQACGQLATLPENVVKFQKP
jgi:hypothetical protein